MLSQSQIAQYWGPACSGQKSTVALYGAGKVTVRNAAIEATKALNACLKTYNYYTRYHDTGAYVCRQKVSGNGWSNHSYATAIDINWQLNPYGGSRHHIPSALGAAICRIKTNNGRQVWNWGGYWSGTRDWMHFEIVCSPYDISTGINWSTVAGKPVGATSSPIYTPNPIKVPEEDIMASLGDLQKVVDGQNQWIREELVRVVRSLVTEIRSDSDENRQNQWIRDELSRQTGALTKEIRAQTETLSVAIIALTEAIEKLSQQ